MYGWFSSSSPVPSAPSSVKQHNQIAKAHVFSCDNLHVQCARDFIRIVERSMNSSSQFFQISLTTIEDEHSENTMVTIGAVLTIARVLSNISNHQSIKTLRHLTSITLAFELGKLEHTLQPNDRVIVLSNSTRIAEMFDGMVVRGVKIKVLGFTPSPLALPPPPPPPPPPSPPTPVQVAPDEETDNIRCVL